mgnify:CR=1 FL=1
MPNELTCALQLIFVQAIATYMKHFRRTSAKFPPFLIRQGHVAKGILDVMFGPYLELSRSKVLNVLQFSKVTSCMCVTQLLQRADAISVGTIGIAGVEMTTDIVMSRCVARYNMNPYFHTNTLSHDFSPNATLFVDLFQLVGDKT